MTENPSTSMAMSHPAVLLATPEGRPSPAGYSSAARALRPDPMSPLPPPTHNPSALTRSANDPPHPAPPRLFAHSDALHLPAAASFNSTFQLRAMRHTDALRPRAAKRLLVWRQNWFKIAGTAFPTTTPNAIPTMTGASMMNAPIATPIAIAPFVLPTASPREAPIANSIPPAPRPRTGADTIGPFARRREDLVTERFSQ